MYLLKRRPLFYIVGLILMVIYITSMTKDKDYKVSSDSKRSGKKRCFTTSLTHQNWNELTVQRNCNRFIKATADMGGTGNLMFQISSIFGMAYDYDIIPIVNENSSLNKYFDLPNVFNITTLANADLCYFKHTRYKACEHSKFKNVSIKGYVLSWKHFRNIIPLVKRMFKFKAEYLERARAFLGSVSRPGYQNVCIHVRRGDFLQRYNRKIGRIVTTPEYINKTMSYYSSKYKHVTFIVLSDDIPWCMANTRGVAYSPFKSAGDDMALMSLCDHVIVTVGTFGWWGAWLSGGEIVYMKDQLRKRTKLYRKYRRDDIYPSNWTAM